MLPFGGIAHFIRKAGGREDCQLPPTVSSAANIDVDIVCLVARPSGPGPAQGTPLAMQAHAKWGKCVANSGQRVADRTGTVWPCRAAVVVCVSTTVAC